MSSHSRSIETEQAREMLVKFITSKTPPFTVTITDGKNRTSPQNKLQRLWVLEIHQQLGDRTPEEVRGYCKLHFGVPILRHENPAFKEEYDKVIRPLPYEAKLKLMMEPFDFGITRIMTTRQKTAYLDAINQHFSEQGVILTNPEDLKFRGAA